MAEGLKPGDRLPNERELVAGFGCSRSTVREALSALELEGLIVTRTGPGGGAYIAQAGIYQAERALRNYLHFQQLDSQQVYELRKIVEVELAASVVGRLAEEDFLRLAENIRVCEQIPVDQDAQRAQRIAELEFHNLLAAACPNPLLAFMGHCINGLLRDLVDLRETFKPKRRQFAESNCRYHRLLLDAYRRADEPAVRDLMYEHMCDAAGHMRALEAAVANRFLLDFEAGGPAVGAR